MTTAFTVTASPDNTHFTMRDGGWNLTAPLRDLPKWVALYQKLHDRKEQFAHFYTHPLQTLIAFQKDMANK